MALPTNRIKKIKLPNNTTYDIVPEMLQKDGFSAELPTLTQNTTLATIDDITSGGDNQKVKTSSVTFGANDTVEIKAGSNVTITGDATAKTITISATDTTYSTATQSASGLMSSADKTKLDGIATGATANIGTITGVSVNGTSVATSGVAALTNIAKTNANNNFSVKQIIDSSSYDDYLFTIKAHYDNEGQIMVGAIAEFKIYPSVSNGNLTLHTAHLGSGGIAENDSYFRFPGGKGTSNNPAIIATTDQIPSSYVSSVNGSTGAITNVAMTNASNTFNGDQTISGGFLRINSDNYNTYSGDDWDTTFYADKIQIQNADTDAEWTLRFPELNDQTEKTLATTDTVSANPSSTSSTLNSLTVDGTSYKIRNTEVIEASSVRIWSLDPGVYRIKNTSANAISTIIYYYGSSNTSSMFTMYSTDFVLTITGATATGTTKYWEIINNSSTALPYIYFGYTTSSSGSYASRNLSYLPSTNPATAYVARKGVSVGTSAASIGTTNALYLVVPNGASTTFFVSGSSLGTLTGLGYAKVTGTSGSTGSITLYNSNGSSVGSKSSLSASTSFGPGSGTLILLTN